jgi:acyl-CoA dehydrogenase
MKILDWLLSNGSRTRPAEITSFDEWRGIFKRACSDWSEPMDQAIAGGFLSDRTGYAFAAGYESALRRLVPSLPAEPIVSLCITEEKGARPSDVASSLKKTGNEATWVINGSKKFATLAPDAERLLVAASVGTAADGKNMIRMVIVDSDAAGLDVEPMSGLGIVPEIRHGTLTLSGVMIGEDRILNGDGYADYIKPFRTIEDLYVQAAVAGYVFRAACAYGWPRTFKEEAISLLACVRALAAEHPLSPDLHIAMGGLGRQLSSLFDAAGPFWDTSDRAARDRWFRDKPLLSVASGSRARRLDNAWSRY